MKKITISQSAFQTLIICSLRYALGRCTFVVEEIASLILVSWPKIQDCNRKIIIRDIKTALEQNKAGMTCDIKTWSRLLEDLENE